MTPAEIVIKEFNGIAPLARALGISSATVCRWRRPRPKDPQGGQVPGKHHRRIIEIAKDRNLPIVLKDLWYGREEQE